MKAWVVPAAAVAALSLPAPAQAARACHPPGSHTQAKDALVRVFSVKSGLYACRTGGSRVTLQPPGQSWRPRPGVDVRGSNVAFVRENCDELSCYPELRVLQVRRRSARELLDTFPLAQRQDEVRVERVLLGPHAALVWTECELVANNRFRCAPGAESQKAVFSQKTSDELPMQLASGTGIDSMSLRVSGNVASWLDGGQPQSAPIR